jgi:hypothetical protein
LHTGVDAMLISAAACAAQPRCAAQLHIVAMRCVCADRLHAIATVAVAALRVQRSRLQRCVCSVAVWHRLPEGPGLGVRGTS